MNRFNKMILGILLSCLCLGLSACGKNGTSSDAAPSPEYCVIQGQTISFLTDEKKESLRAPLEKLLANQEIEVYSEDARGELLGFQVPDPLAPSIPPGYRCGLLDITGDGIPELLVHPRGYYGSSGTSTYFIYDIPTGKKIGSIDGGNDESWCTYYNVTTGECAMVGQYWLRFGWASRMRFLGFVEYNAESGLYYDGSFLSSQYDIAHSDPLTGEEIYPDTRYFIHGKKVYLDDYYSELDRFTREWIRIPETALQLIDWDDVCSSEEEQTIRAAKMAEALLGSTQEFVVPEK
ncbi:MAG: hypothetical protein IJX28_05765 [Clostridia bacterium]|nr:hypothetical protein [Clostridia bacterium]